MAKQRTSFTCNECGYVSVRSLGKCPECGAWSSFVEKVDHHIKAARRDSRRALTASESPRPIAEIEASEGERVTTGIAEFDRILGGGLVAGSAILIGGDPGIGKSTLVLQACAALAKQGERVLYVSGEESGYQLKLRASRLGLEAEQLYVVAETSMEIIQQHVQEFEPTLTVVDSIQMVHSADITSAPGSVSQVRECAAGLIFHAKANGASLILIGHVTKDGNIAGPRTLEHMVDTVLGFEGDRFHSYRILRAAKNRFGATSEIGIFEMTQKGLVEVDNPSRIFISEYDHQRSGAAIFPSVEGTRVLLVELQALVAPSPLAAPRRKVSGVDGNRAAMLLAVLERRAGIRLSQLEAFINVVGGVTIDEPAADLALCVAVVSSQRDMTLPSGTVVIGEVGLGGEVRSVNLLRQRLDEARRLGFERAVVPRPRGDMQLDTPDGIEVIPVSGVVETLDRLGLWS
ncbi:MAG: DNA repair protein RadA [Planctomycetes bacterium]|nr:DNA repair protein RadA [Planctomycetota bacterium]